MKCKCKMAKTPVLRYQRKTKVFGPFALMTLQQGCLRKLVYGADWEEGRSDLEKSFERA